MPRRLLPAHPAILPPDASTAALATQLAHGTTTHSLVTPTQAAGIRPLSCGVITPRDDDEIRNMFEYARDAGIPTVVCKPTRASLPTLDKMVKEFDIKVAIHNHGPEDKVWPSPLDAWEAIGS